MDQHPRMLEDLLRRSSWIHAHEGAPGIMPGASTVSAPMNPLVDIPRNGHGVIVDFDALLIKPPREVFSLRKDVMFLPASRRELSRRRDDLFRGTVPVGKRHDSATRELLRAAPVSSGPHSWGSRRCRRPTGWETRQFERTWRLLAAIEATGITQTKESDTLIFFRCAALLLRSFPCLLNARA